MLDSLSFTPATAATPLQLLSSKQFLPWLEQQGGRRRRWVSASGFSAKPGTMCLIPSDDGQLALVLVGVSEGDDWALGQLVNQLPDGHYVLDGQLDLHYLQRLTVGWALGAYRFNRYRSQSELRRVRLHVHPSLDERALRAEIESIIWVRDLINTPAHDLQPEQLADAALSLARRYGASFVQWVGEELLQANYPAIHAVGRASCHTPRLLELRWGRAGDPKVTLVGKGVCFDSGGLDIKPSSAMRLMKKDMGGAAHVLGLAQWIMATELPICLRVLIPAVENAISERAFRPGDVLATRKGLSVEVDNTDAEGRLILCDALTEAVSEHPELVLDFATLTGAARVALGTEIAALFCNDEQLAQDLAAASVASEDPIWRLPLHRPYRQMLDSKIADLANSGSSPYAGAISAALFLQEFIPEGQLWAHFDVMAWNVRSRPGRPEGGEAMGLRAVYRYLQQRYLG